MNHLFYSIRLPKLTPDCEVDDGRIYVNKFSNDSHLSCLSRFSKYFSREGNYGMPAEYIWNTTAFEGYLLADPYAQVVFGAVVFTPMTGTARLDWVWLHPYFRKRQVFQKHWDYLLNKYANESNGYRVLVQRPLSHAMLAFLKKQRQLEKISLSCDLDDPDLLDVCSNRSLIVTKGTAPSTT